MTVYVLPVYFPSGIVGDPIPALSSDDVANMLGVGVHMSSDFPIYGDTTQVTSLLTGLGVKHVRDTYNYNFPTQHTHQKTIAANAGVKFTMATRLSDPISSWVNGMVSDTMGPICEAIEGINEPDNAGGSWVTNTRTHHQAFYPAVKAQASLSALPVLAPALANSITNASALGSLSAYSDKANAHVYSGNPPSGVGSYTLANTYTKARTVAGTGKPVIITEQGYHNAPSSGSSIPYVDEATAGIYAPKILLENVLAGAERVFIYELIDQGTSTTDSQQRYGLCHNDFTPKPAYTAVASLLSVLSDPGSPYSPAPLALRVSAPFGDTSLRTLLVGKRDGSYRLILWRDVPVWDYTAVSAISVTPISVTVTYPSGSTTVSIGGAWTYVTIPA